MGTTIADQFKPYADLATERECDRLRVDGLEGCLCHWMNQDEGRAGILAGWLEGFAHESLTARDEQGTYDALARLVRGLKPWAARYVDSWDYERMADFIDQVREEEHLANLSYGEGEP